MKLKCISKNRLKINTWNDDRAFYDNLKKKKNSRMLIIFAKMMNEDNLMKRSILSL